MAGEAVPACPGPQFGDLGMPACPGRRFGDFGMPACPGPQFDDFGMPACPGRQFGGFGLPPCPGRQIDEFDMPACPNDRGGNLLSSGAVESFWGALWLELWPFLYIMEGEKILSERSFT